MRRSRTSLWTSARPPAASESTHSRFRASRDEELLRTLGLHRPSSHDVPAALVTPPGRLRAPLPPVASLAPRDSSGSASRSAPSGRFAGASRFLRVGFTLHSLRSLRWRLAIPPGRLHAPLPPVASLAPRDSSGSASRSTPSGRFAGASRFLRVGFTLHSLRSLRWRLAIPPGRLHAPLPPVASLAPRDSSGSASRSTPSGRFAGASLVSAT